MREKPIVHVILGPTASGKTDYTIELAQKLGGAVISADSRQVYAGMNIGTATPLRSAAGGGYGGQAPHDILMPDIIQNIPHYLFNIRTPNQPLTLSEWQAAAYSVLDMLHKNSTPAVLAGGTMLYIDSILFNYDIPNVPPNEKLRAILEATPTQKLFAQLKEKDPAALKFIEPRNKRRIIRALEVMQATGKTFSELRQKREPRYLFEIIGLKTSWDELRVRITKRAQWMLENGLLEETKKLREMYGAGLPLLQTMNYREAGAVLDSKITKKEALDQTVRANVRYARRQMSWWRSRHDINWVTTTRPSGRSRT